MPKTQCLWGIFFRTSVNSHSPYSTTRFWRHEGQSGGACTRKPKDIRGRSCRIESGRSRIASRRNPDTCKSHPLYMVARIRIGARRDRPKSFPVSRSGFPRSCRTGCPWGFEACRLLRCRRPAPSCRKLVLANRIWRRKNADFSFRLW
jgi:hypothetical protein